MLTLSPSPYQLYLNFSSSLNIALEKAMIFSIWRHLGLFAVSKLDQDSAVNSLMTFYFLSFIDMYIGNPSDMF